MSAQAAKRIFEIIAMKAREMMEIFGDNGAVVMDSSDDRFYKGSKGGAAMNLNEKIG